MNALALRAVLALEGWGRALASKFQDEEGQTLAEYALIVSTLVVAVIVLTGFVFRNAIVGSFNSATNCLNNASGSTGTC
ncbi:MAG: Flp family type IVb pilin [Dehalococcoidia bacterium]